MLISLVILISSCGKGDATASNNTTPSNLLVSATVSTDNSGNVSFIAAATNAVSYEYDYGNGIYSTVASGIVTYKYPASGTYTVNVIAKSAGGQTLSKSIQVTVVVTLSLTWSEEFNVAGPPDPAK